MNRKFLLTVASAFAIALCGCSAGTLDVQSRDAQQNEKVSESSKNAKLPLDSLHDTAEIAIQDRAVFLAAKECLEATGVDVKQIQNTYQAPSEENSSPKEIERYIGNLDKEQAQNHGYRSNNAQGTSVRHTAGGVDCWTPAAQVVFGKISQTNESSTEIEEAKDEIFDGVISSPAAKAATSKWRECMRSANIPADTPAGILVDGKVFSAGEIREEGTVTQHEKNVAVTDIDCKMSSGYAQTITSQLRTEQEAWMRKNQNTVTSNRDLHKKMTAAARDYLDKN